MGYFIDEWHHLGEAKDDEKPSLSNDMRADSLISLEIILGKIRGHHGLGFRDLAGS